MCWAALGRVGLNKDHLGWVEPLGSIAYWLRVGAPLLDLALP